MVLKKLVSSLSSSKSKQSPSPPNSKNPPSPSSQRSSTALSTRYEPVRWEEWRSRVEQKYIEGRPYMFSVVWELRKFLQNNVDNVAQLDSVMVLAGDAEQAYMTTCNDYVREKWSNLGIFAFNAACHLQLHGSFTSANIDMQLDRGNDQWNERVTVQTWNLTLDEVVTVVQTLAFIAVSCRDFDKKQLSCSSALAGEEPYLEVFLDPLDPVLPNDNESCWRALCRGAVIARHFPAGHSGEKGLEIPFDAMLQLTDITFSVDRFKHYDGKKHGVYYASPNTLLYPIARGQKENVLRWHCSVSNKKIKPLKDNKWLTRCTREEQKSAIAVLE